MGIQINGNTNNINAGIGSLSIEDINELDIVGVATAANFKTGVSNLHSLGLTLSGGQLDVGSNIKLGNAGVITATTAFFSGNITANRFTGTDGNAVTLGDSKKIVLGTGSDLEIYHASNQNYVTVVGDGNLNLTSATSVVIKTATSKDAVVCNNGGSTDLYHNNSKKFETTSSGATVTGTLTATAFSGDGSNLTGITGTTINSNTDNYLITGTGTANTLQGEANLTFTGKTLTTQTTSYPETTELTTEFKAGVANGNRYLNRYIKLTNTYTGSAHGGIPIVWEANADGSNNKSYGSIGMFSDGAITFYSRGAGAAANVGSSLGMTEKLRIGNDGILVTYGTGAVNAEFNTSLAAGAYHKYDLSASGATTGYIGAGQQIVTGAAIADFGIRSQSNMVFSTGGSTERLRIKSDGEVNFALDAVFTNSSWTGNKAGKIQHHNNWLYMQAGTSGIKLRSSNGSDETLFSGRKIDIEGGRNSSDDALVVHMEDNRYRKIQLAEATVSHAVGTYGGFIGYDASNNWMSLGTNQAGTVHEGMRFHRSGGYVTKPTQPKFSAYMANTYSWNNQIIVWDSELYDVGNHYNTSNGKFTAPVAGYYVFGVKFRANGGFSQFGGMWTKNSSTYKRAFGQNSYAQGDCITAVDVIPMSANDTMGLRFEGSHGGATGGAHENGFWGYLLG